MGGEGATGKGELCWRFVPSLILSGVTSLGLLPMPAL